jgi:hypothetical protein
MIGLRMQPNSVAIWARDPATLGALVSFLISNTDIPLPGRVRLDVTRSIQGSKRYEATRSPVERHVAQDVIRQPLELTVSGILTATPLSVFRPPIPFGIARLDLIELAKLKAIADRRDIVIVTTPVGVYPSMVITSLEDRHGEGEKVDLTISFSEIQIASPILVDVAMDVDSLIASHYGSFNSGGQSGSSVPDPGGLG